MELLDVYDSLGNRTGRIVERGNKDEVFGEDEHMHMLAIVLRKK